MLFYVGTTIVAVFGAEWEPFVGPDALKLAHDWLNVQWRQHTGDRRG